MSSYHRAVLCAEMIEYLAPQPHGVYVDCTFGGGTHTREILRAEPTCKVIGFDWDERALRMNAEAIEQEFPGRFTPIWSNFSAIKQQLQKRGIRAVDGILADLGTSQFQLKHADGFSFDTDTDLDMRMSPAHQHTTAAHIVNNADEAELAHMLWEYGDERAAREIARAIVARRPLHTGRALAMVVSDVVRRAQRDEGGRVSRVHPATKTFQALRIVVNREFDNIRALIRVVPSLVKPGGRFLCMTFHSGEDRLVKHLLLEQRDLWTPLSKHVIVPTESEVAENPSARSVKLRAMMRRS